MTRQRLPIWSDPSDPRPACTCGGRNGLNPDSIGGHHSGCPAGAWVWREAVRRQAHERHEAPPVFDEVVQRAAGEAIRDQANAETQAGMRDLQRLMSVARRAQGLVGDVDIQSLSPQELLARFAEAAGGMDNLRDLMTGAPAARLRAPVIEEANPPPRTRRRTTGQRRPITRANQRQRAETPDLADLQRVWREAPCTCTGDVFEMEDHEFDCEQARAVRALYGVDHGIVDNAGRWRPSPHRAAEEAAAEADRLAQERELPPTDMSNLTAGEWVRVREDANILANHLKGKSGRVCENQHSIHQSMADNDKFVTLWFPCDPDDTHRFRKTALDGRGNIPDCTCSGTAMRSRHEDDCETMIFRRAYPTGRLETPPAPRKRKWGV